MTLLTVHKSPYWRSKQNAIDIIMILEEVDYGFNGSDTSFLKKFKGFFYLFTLSFSRTITRLWLFSCIITLSLVFMEK